MLSMKLLLVEGACLIEVYNNCTMFVNKNIIFQQFLCTVIKFNAAMIIWAVCLIKC